MTKKFSPRNISLILFSIGIVLLLASLILGALRIPQSNTSQITSVEYRNTTYGLAVALPESWRNYSVTLDTWTGNTIADELGEVPFTTGTVVSIHNPKWTGANSYQDIPIMVFTLSQWSLLQQEKFHIGAAPIDPSELGRNEKYVFALPARYNFAYPPGYEEVDAIMQSKPVSTFSPDAHK